MRTLTGIPEYPPSGSDSDRAGKGLYRKWRRDVFVKRRFDSITENLAKLLLNPVDLSAASGDMPRTAFGAIADLALAIKTAGDPHVARNALQQARQAETATLEELGAIIVTGSWSAAYPDFTALRAGMVFKRLLDNNPHCLESSTPAEEALKQNPDYVTARLIQWQSPGDMDCFRQRQTTAAAGIAIMAAGLELPSYLSTIPYQAQQELRSAYGPHPAHFFEPVN